jgi:hypothetical protein
LSRRTNYPSVYSHRTFHAECHSSPGK